MMFTVWVYNEEGDEIVELRRTLNTFDNFHGFDEFVHSLMIARRTFRVTPY
jgi:hypothetical protein